MEVSDPRHDAGFTLIEVLIATAVFVLVATAAFEAVRGLGVATASLAARTAASASLAVALERMRTDASSSVAVWIPPSTCGAAVAMLRRDAAGTSYAVYVVRNGTLLRASGAGPLDPCDGGLSGNALVGGVAGFGATAIAANAWAAHVDPLGGESDGAFFAASVPAVAVDAHARDVDGSTIRSGNGAVEVTIDADPFATVVDLVAGNRPSGFTETLAYACGARCALTGDFPEIASLDLDGCSADAPALPDSSAYYVAASTGLDPTGRIVTTTYALHLRYDFTFSGASPGLTVERDGPLQTWPSGTTLADPYPVDYDDNALRATGAAALAAAFGPPASLASAFADCAGVDDEPLFHG